MLGTSSPNTMRHVDSPATFAASTKSRFRSDSAWPRRMRASNAHNVSARNRIIDSCPAREVGRRDDEQRDGRDDEEDVRQEVDRSSTMPPEYAARIPSVAAINVASAPDAAPRMQRAPGAHHDLREDVAALVGRPEQVVPCRRLPCVHQAECRGVRPEMSGPISATTTMKPRMTRPTRDFGLRSSSVSQPGSRTRARRAGGSTCANSIVGWSCDIASRSSRAGRERG